MKQNTFLLVLIIFMLFISMNLCAKAQTLKDAYPNLYKVNPVTILILPPINQSTAAEAKELMACTLAEPLAMKGYYPLPMEAMFTVLREEGLYDTETLTPPVLANLHKYFGADAALETTIIRWNKKTVTQFKVGEGIKTKITVDIKVNYRLLDTQTGEELWAFQSEITGTPPSAPSGKTSLKEIMRSVTSSLISPDYFYSAYNINKLTIGAYLPSGKKNTPDKKELKQTVPKDKLKKFSFSA
jgi:hypothetical protein